MAMGSRKLALLAITPPDIRVLSFAKDRCYNIALAVLRRVVLPHYCMVLNPSME